MKKSVYLSSLLAFCLSLFAAKANAQAPVVTTDPANSTICAHDTTYFHVVATGATPLSFMWQYSDDAVHHGILFLMAPLTSGQQTTHSL